MHKDNTPSLACLSIYKAPVLAYTLNMKKLIWKGANIMFIEILYYTIIISGALFLATSVIRLIDRIDRPKEKPVPHTRPAAHRRRAKSVSNAKRAA